MNLYLNSAHSHGVFTKVMKVVESYIIGKLIMCVCWIVSAIGSSDQETKTARRSLGFSKVIENANKDISTSEYVDEVKVPNVCVMLV